MKKLFSDDRIIGFSRKTDSGLPVKELCRLHGFSEQSFYKTHINSPCGAYQAVEKRSEYLPIIEYIDHEFMFYDSLSLVKVIT